MRFHNAELAPHTIASYAADWRVFVTWCAAAKRAPLPASSETVELYLTDLVGQGRKLTTAERHAAAIRHYHRQENHPSPCDQNVRELLAGARRTLSEMPKQKEAFTVAQIRRMVGSFKGKPAVVARNRALLLVGFASALRRSSLAGLNVSDISFCPEGLVLTVHHEKQDRKGTGRQVAVPRGRKGLDPVAALKCWMRYSGNQPGPLFCRCVNGVPSGKRMLGNRIAQIVQEAAAAIGLDPKLYGAHSLRVSFVTEALAHGASPLAVAQQTGHKSLDTLKIYLRPRELFRGNAAGSLGL